MEFNLIVGFFIVSVLSEKYRFKSCPRKGFHVVEDFKLDFHLSDDEIQDALKNW